MDLEGAAELQALAEEVVRVAKEMERSGLVDGTAGNVSAIDRARRHVLITPTGVPYGELQATQLPTVGLDGSVLRGDYRPSSEVEMHLECYRTRADVSGVVHTHSRFATTFAVLNRAIASVHYVLAFAGPGVEVAPYATYGTPELAGRCAETLGERNAVLLQNHGVIAVGRSAAAALNVAQVVEYTAELLWRALAVGKPTVLSDDEMARVASKFESYGQPQHLHAAVEQHL